MGRKWLVGILIVFSAALILGCAQQPQQPQQPATTPTAGAEKVETLYFGVPISLSGKYAEEGKASLEGMKIATKWINDKGGIKVGEKIYRVELKVYDDESKKENVQSLIERLATVDKVKFILAPYSSGLTLAAAPIAEKYQVLLNSHGGASDYIFEQGYYYVVQTLSPASKYQTGFVDMVKAKYPDAKRIALVYEDEEFSRAVHKAAGEYAKKLGFEIVFEKTYPLGATDLSPILNELKATSPDIIIGGGHFADGQLLAKQLAELKINVKAISILVAPTFPKFYEALGNEAEGIAGPSQWEVGVKYSPDVAKELGIEWYGPTQDEFINEYTKATGKLPPYQAAEATAAVLSYAKAIEKAQSLDHVKVREAMSNLKFMCVYGIWKIDPKTGKQVGHEMVIVQWQNGEKKIVWPESAANANPCIPMPTWDEKKGGAVCRS